MSDRIRSSSDLLKRINDHIDTIAVDSLSPYVCEFINDEYNMEKDKIVTNEHKRMEEVEFHNLTTIHNIGKLWEILHTQTIIKREGSLDNLPL